MLTTKTIILAATVTAKGFNAHLTEKRLVEIKTTEMIFNNGKTIPQSPEGVNLRKPNRNQVLYGKQTR